jgi:hypothetical protein
MKKSRHFSECEDLLVLYTNLFDAGNPHEHPPTHHVVHLVRCSYNKTLNNKSKQQIFQVVTDKEIVLQDSPSRMH